MTPELNTNPETSVSRYQLGSASHKLGECHEDGEFFRGSCSSSELEQVHSERYARSGAIEKPPVTDL